MDNIFGSDIDELRALAAEYGEPSYRGTQIYTWLYEKGIRSFEEMTDLPAGFREKLSAECRISVPRVTDSRKSFDGSVKYLFELDDGCFVETVKMPSADYAAFCVSTQTGCPLQCAFCATGRMGFDRNLTAGEIIGQITELTDGNEEESVNILIMGMGEPLLNCDNVLKAVRIMNGGLNISHRRITLSTAGIIPGLVKLREEPVRPNISVSLNAVDDKVRSELMPVNDKYPIESLLTALETYPVKKGETVTLEYVLLRGVNDSDGEARKLADISKRVSAKVNLIPYNGKWDQGFRPPPERRVETFRSILSGSGVTVTVRRSRGADIQAACGQLCPDKKDMRPNS